MKSKPLVELACVAKAENLKLIRDETRRGLEEAGYLKETVDPIVLALNEACMNVIQHAYGNRGAGVINLEVYAGRDDISLHVTDFAEPVCESVLQPRKLDEIRPGGLGTHFIRQIMDEISCKPRQDNKGNVLIMKKRVSHQNRLNGG